MRASAIARLSQEGLVYVFLDSSIQFSTVYVLDLSCKLLIGFVLIIIIGLVEYKFNVVFIYRRPPLEIIIYITNTMFSRWVVSY